ncbi:transmembrane protein 42-like [Phlebotomus papatasi]|uniref:EamA domain-containing protein n=1 Tax=Phlebotomus papatasi TaxID=29031 RepID=A0A1B0DPU5_PHLPP|nr:transmembrane protein 42-like [Phlebotomus papatasi]
MFAILSGLCAAGASVFGKLSSTVESQDVLGWTLKACCIIFMIILNTLVWTFFVKALHSGSGGSVGATVVSSGTNYFTSALLGWVIFGETTSLFWWFGTSLIITGIILISIPDKKEKHQ